MDERRVIARWLFFLVSHYGVFVPFVAVRSFVLVLTFFSASYFHRPDFDNNEISNFMDGGNVLSRSAGCRFPIKSWYILLVCQKIAFRKELIARLSETFLFSNSPALFESPLSSSFPLQPYALCAMLSAIHDLPFTISGRS
jgi:hypothetical protein